MNNDFLLNIDDLGETQEKSTPDATVGGDLVISKNPKQPAEKINLNIGGAEKLEDVYDRMMKLIFLFDTSGSMSEQIINDDDLNAWLWDMGAIRRKLADCADEVQNAKSGGYEMSLDPMTVKCAESINASDDEIKRLILHESLTAYFNVMPLGRQATKSKMEVVKDLATSEIRKRILKYNEADIRVVTFDYNPHVSGATSEKDLVTSVSSMYPSGGTDICAAIEGTIRLCKKSPSPVNLHHIVLVSDGQDYGALRVETLLPEMKRLGIVLDFIYIEGTPGSGVEGAAEALRRVCKATGGDYVVVRKAKDLETKFIAAAERKLLPAPATV